MGNLYDHKIASADGENPDILDDCKGKVTLVFNIAAGCGNYPQMIALKALDEHYENEDDFQIRAIVVDDFTCHGYGEFNDGLEAFADNEETGGYQNLTPGQIAERYAQNNYGVKFQFSELTNGRFDKHVYDPEWKPGAQYEQEMHLFWQDLVECADLPRDENNLPHHHEASPWSAEPQEIDTSKTGFTGLQGNFEKFLIDRDGRRSRRYANGFLLGERNADGQFFSWWKEDQEVKRPDWNDPEWFGPDGEILPEVAEVNSIDETGHVVYPNAYQKRGIEESLSVMYEDIDYLLGKRPTESAPVEEREWSLPSQMVKADHMEYGSKFKVGEGVQQAV